MALAFVATNNDNFTTGNSLGVAYTSNNTAHNQLAVFVGCTNASASITSITGNGNTYVLKNTVAGQGQTVWEYVVSDCAAGANTVSVAVDSSGGFLEVVVLEISGGDTTTPVDQVAGQTGNGDPWSTGNLVTGFANEILIGYCLPFTNGSSFEGGWTGVLTAASAQYEYLIVSSTGTYAATGTQSGGGNNWSAIGLSIKQAGAGGSAPVYANNPPVLYP